MQGAKRKFWNRRPWQCSTTTSRCMVYGVWCMRIVSAWMRKLTRSQHSSMTAPLRVAIGCHGTWVRRRAYPTPSLVTGIWAREHYYNTTPSSSQSFARLIKEHPLRTTTATAMISRVAKATEMNTYCCPASDVIALLWLRWDFRLPHPLPVSL